MRSDKTMILGALLLALFCLGVAGCQGGSGANSTPSNTQTSTVDTAGSPAKILPPSSPCELSVLGSGPGNGFGREFSTQFFDWTSDGRHLIVPIQRENHLSRSIIRTIDAESYQWGQVVDANPEGRFQYGFYADASPVDSRIVYASCEYWTKGSSYLERFNYEIATIGIYGTDPKRLTKNRRLDHYPVWSPDGARIAFISASGTPFPDFDRAWLLTMSSDGSDVSKRLNPFGVPVGLYPPVWSLDGEWLVFIAKEGESYPIREVLYTVRTDGSEPTRIGETTTPATWSSDSGELAFAAVHEWAAVIYAVRPDDTGLRTVWRGEPGYPAASISQVSWSPDGTEILFIAPDGIHIVDLEDGGLRTLTNRNWESVGAAWSPDGERIAIYVPGEQFVTVARDGSDLRVLAHEDANSDLITLNPEEAESP